MFQSRKIVMLLASLLAACLLWLYVVTTVAPEISVRISNIPVTIDGSLILEDRDLVITDQDIDSITLELSTNRANLSKLNAETIRVSADASKIRVDGSYELNYTITFPDTVRANDVDIQRKSSDNVHITVSKRKSVPVRLNWSGTVKEGYLFEAESAVFDPYEITLIGPSEEIDAVKEAVISYDISELQETEILSLPVTFVDDTGARVALSDNTTVSASEVRATLPMTGTRELRLAVDLIPGGGVQRENAKVTIEPSSVKVKGSAEVLNKLGDRLEIGSIELSEIQEKKTFTFNLALPAGVTNMSGDDSAEVTVTISGVTTSTISVSDIQLINVPTGCEARVTSRNVKVTVRGSTQEIEKLKEQNQNGIYILVDLEDCNGTGEFTVTGKVVNENHPGIAVRETAEIGVSIIAPPTSDSSEPEG